jgi:hypothetical protein
MTRKTLIALVGVLSVASASAAMAAQLDGDNNPVPGVFVNQPASALERSHAGPRPAASGITAQDKAFWDRQSEVH